MGAADLVFVGRGPTVSVVRGGAPSRENHLRAVAAGVWCRSMLGSQRKLLVALLAAVFAFFGAMTVAQAAPGFTPPSRPNAGPASPGTFAARYGAPMCDDRAASSYAAEPTPPEVDAGRLEPATDAGGPFLQHCRGTAYTMEQGAPVPADDLRAPSLDARDVAVLPAPVFVAEPVESLASVDRSVVDGARDGHPQGDNPPPRPIPWLH